MSARVRRRDLASLAAAGMMLFWSTGARADLVASAVSCLQDLQNEDHTWGDPAGTRLRDTAVVLSALRSIGQASSDAALDGRVALQGLDAANNDYLARQITALSAPGASYAALIDELLDVQNAAAPFPAEPNFPEGGWGVAEQFGTETLATTLALDALRAGGVPAALTVFDDVVTAPGQNTYTFEFPAGADGLALFVRSVTGSIRVLVDTPQSGTFQLTTSSPIAVGILEEPGTYGLRVQSVSGSPNTYSLDIGFEAGGFDVSRIPQALRYIQAAQNPDGGWGLRRGEDSLLMITTEVVQTLRALGESVDAPEMLGSAIDSIESHQNDGGGFGQDASTVYETALALLALRGGGSSPAILDAAAAYLAGEQEDDGCWNDDAYATALAMSALFAPDDGVFCNGVEVCNLVDGCATEDVPDCDDEVACTADACNEVTDECTHVATDALCSDGEYCNGAEVCDEQDGCGPAHPDYAPDCNDHVPCTIDSCSEATDSCTHAPDHASCADDLFCNGDEVCDPEEGCVDGTRNCADAHACTADGCDETENACTHTPNDAVCANANPCDNDVCQVATGCAHVNNTAACDDGQECTSGDHCALGVCTGTPIPGCGDTTTTTTTTLPEGPLCGDFNGSGTLTASDALGALRTAVGTATCPLAVCDFNGNGTVTASDALAILKLAVGIVVAPNCPLPAAAAEVEASTTTTTVAPTPEAED
ncbi:MAG TPA: hypothetical protein VEC57_17690 [Candidatus Limnocylindrales bacterium]|nr:hypothetical protein [Candidatus Limnocylindrales bacterium]